jgi:tRNA(fMet)-specific endonuclease VapC
LTTPLFLLDANILSEAMKLNSDAQVTKKLAENITVSATATVVYHEIKFGCLILPESRRKQAMESYVQQNVEALLPMFSYCEASAQWHAQERARLRKIGLTPPYVDGQIAAIAAINNLTLVTRNVADFQNFQNLSIENWFE